MTKKKKNYYKNLIYTRGGFVEHATIQRILLFSLIKNQIAKPYTRIALLNENYLSCSSLSYSRPKLKCIVTTSKRVPSRFYGTGRYFLNKYIDNLHYNSILKK